MKDMKLAVTRIIQAINAGDLIRIYGDYDADGVSSTSLWYIVLKALGAKVSYFVPNRFTDGYGVHEHAIDQFSKDKINLMITCDTGITAIKQIAYAKKLGIEVIVTDHHEPQLVGSYDAAIATLGKQTLDSSGTPYLIPDTIVVNPKRPDCKYPFKSLAGVGVSFKVLSAVCDKIHPDGKKALYKYMDIVALGTIADVMDMVDENRVICSLGLHRMGKSKNRGLHQLLRATELDGKQITSKDIGWTLAPCINAAGRIVSAGEAVEMLISDNKLDAYRAAKKLVEINKERKEVTKAYVGDIITTIEARQEQQPSSIIVHYHPQIPEGIVGLVAARVSNHFYKPTIILTDAEEDGIYKGSGRSIPALDLFRSLMGMTDLMTNFGGHAAACGLSLKAENFEQLRERLEFYADTMLSKKDLVKTMTLDAALSPESMTLSFLERLGEMEPYGNGNKQPIFYMKDVKVVKTKAAGDEKNHFWALLSCRGRTISSIGFFLQSKYEEIGSPSVIDVAFFPAENEYPKGSGRVNVQMLIEDIRPAATKSKKKKGMNKK
ncbi:single-stranded-DNA-specific exonuclease RecJ (plasmid) [Paenibacillus sp. EC2-1]|uniref:single-stranded-DNA-specific exonuclease RecJ n=1 Tax=Paenibacillus sp. EC2-1 TaxID=3388665 RepID=UPI003BEF3EB6